MRFESRINRNIMEFKASKRMGERPRNNRINRNIMEFKGGSISVFHVFF